MNRKIMKLQESFIFFQCIYETQFIICTCLRQTGNFTGTLFSHGITIRINHQNLNLALTLFHYYKFLKKIVLIYLIFAKKRQNTSILSHFCQVLLYLDVAPHPSVMFYVECVFHFNLRMWHFLLLNIQSTILVRCPMSVINVKL